MTRRNSGDEAKARVEKAVECLDGSTPESAATTARIDARRHASATTDKGGG